MEKNELLEKNEADDGEKADDLDEFLEGVPEEDRPVVRKMIGMSMRTGSIISPQLELLKKMTPDHISAFLEGQKEATKYQFKENRENKIFMGFVLIAGLGFVLILVNLLKDYSPDTMEKILYAVGSFVAGLASGYGIRKAKGDD